MTWPRWITSMFQSNLTSNTAREHKNLTPPLALWSLYFNHLETLSNPARSVRGPNVSKNTSPKFLYFSSSLFLSLFLDQLFRDFIDTMATEILGMAPQTLVILCGSIVGGEREREKELENWWFVIIPNDRFLRSRRIERSFNLSQWR